MNAKQARELALTTTTEREESLVFEALIELADIKGRIEEWRDDARKKVTATSTTIGSKFILQNEIHRLNILEFGMDRACEMEEEERERERKAEEAWRRGEQATKSDKE